jgi:hypothetical protein
MRAKALGAAATLAVAALVTAGTVRAFNPQPDPPRFGIVGLARGQTAVINAVLGEPPDDNRPACLLVLSFVGADGRTLAGAGGRESRKVVALRGNVAASLSVRAADVLDEGQLRLPIRAVLGNPPDDGVPSDCRGLLASVEIVGPLGHTQLYVPPDPGHPPDTDVPPDPGVTEGR